MEFAHSSLCSHCIVFGHDAPIVASNALRNPQQISEMLILHFFGKNAEDVDRLMRDTVGTSVIMARAYVIYQWLTVLAVINPIYQGDFETPTLTDIQFTCLHNGIDTTNQSDCLGGLCGDVFHFLRSRITLQEVYSYRGLRGRT